MNRYTSNVVGLCLILLFNINRLNAQVATIDLANEKQNISGFGGAHSPEWGVELPLDQVDKTYGIAPGQVGLSIFRTPVPIDTSIFSMEVTAVVSAKTNGADIVSAKVIAAESYNFDHSMTDPILNDASAEPNVDIIGGHIYGGGIADYKLAWDKGKEVWLTAHYISATNWAGDIAIAKEIHNSMIANFNAYMYWYILGETGFLSNGGDILKRGYVMSQFLKFIRPGYAKVNVVTSSATNIDVTAYNNNTNVVIVAISRNTAPVDLNITLQNGSEYIFTKLVATVANGTFFAGKNSIAFNKIKQNYLSFPVTKFIVLLFFLYS